MARFLGSAQERAAAQAQFPGRSFHTNLEHSIASRPKCVSRGTIQAPKYPDSALLNRLDFPTQLSDPATQNYAPTRDHTFPPAPAKWDLRRIIPAGDVLFTDE